MLTYFRRGKFNNVFKIHYAWSVNRPQIKNYTRYVKTLIIRGIGYRAYALTNDFLSTFINNYSFVESLRPIYSEQAYDDYQELTQVVNFEFSKKRYLLIRAGHTRDLVVPLHSLVICMSRKKDRKLLITSRDKALASNTARFVHLYRPPSVYTGRGVRVKHKKVIRKAGKKDKQRGKAF